MGWFSREARSWKRANPIARIGQARAGGRAKSFSQFSAKLAGVGPQESALQGAYRTIRQLREEIRQLKNQIRQLKNINKAQQKMKDRGEPGSYAHYHDGLKRIMALLNSRGDWADVMVPGIRREVNGMLGSNVQWDAKRRRGVNRR